MEFKRVRGPVLVLLVLTLHSWHANTQVAADSAGSIEGMVVDIQGARFVGAEVTATNESTHQQVATVTDFSGSYRDA